MTYNLSQRPDISHNFLDNTYTTKMKMDISELVDKHTYTYENLVTKLCNK